MAPAIRSLESGEAICALTAIDPADSPAIVTRCGSPPKAAMFFCDPLQRGVLIEQRVVAGGVMWRLLGEFGVRHEAEDTEPVVHRQRDDALARHALAVVAGLGTIAATKPPPKK